MVTHLFKWVPPCIRRWCQCHAADTSSRPRIDWSSRRPRPTPLLWDHRWRTTPASQYGANRVRRM